MKKIFTAILFATLVGGVQALEVTTEPTYKSSVIEEYTGIHCGNCPDGHRMASELAHSMPGDVFIVAIHAGGYAEPAGHEPNYITAEGKALHDHYGINSYPCGITSRRDTGKGLVIGRSEWGPSSKIIVKEISPVNLAAACTFDESTRELAVETEGYFTDNMTDPRLTVMVLQNNILGPQNGGLLGIEYPHRHMLRKMLNSEVFGDKVGEGEKGGRFSKTYKCVLPETINDIALIPYDLELLVFVSEGEGEIVKAVECAPEVKATEDTRKIVVSSKPLIPIGNNYALDYLEMIVDNYSGEEVTSLSYDVTLNGENRKLNWNGSIAPHSFKTVRVPLDGWWKECYDKDISDYRIQFASANDSEPVLEHKAIKGSLINIADYPEDLTFKIRTDIDASDNTYRIIDEEGMIVREFGPYPDNDNKVYEENVTLEVDKVYGFEVCDKWGDGIFHPRGNVKIYDNQGALVSQMMEISDYGCRVFFRTQNKSGIDGAIGDKGIVNEIFHDVAGRTIKGTEKGVVIVTSIYSDGSSETFKRINK